MPRSSFAFRFLNFSASSINSRVAALCVASLCPTLQNPLFVQTHSYIAHQQTSEPPTQPKWGCVPILADELYMCPNLRRERQWRSWLSEAPLSFFLGYPVISVFPGVKFCLSSESFAGSTSGRRSSPTSSSSTQMSPIKQHIRARCCLSQPARSSARV